MVRKPTTALMLAATLLAAALLAAVPASSSAARKAIWGPVERDGVSQFPVYRRLRAQIYQTGLSWADTAPTRPASPRDPDDPAYRWPAYLDTAVREARAHRIAVAVNLTAAPGWANGGRTREWAPRNPRDYANFAAAASRRYPWVRYWIIWSEPSRKENFQPMPRFESSGPRVYARILDAAYVALKRVSRRNIVIGGNTFTTGEVAPLHFIRFMRLRGGRRPRFDLYGHNPFTRRRPRLSDPPLGLGFADFGTLDTLARTLDRHYVKCRRTRSGRRRCRGKRKRLFISEFTVPTGHRSHAFSFFERERTAASWLRSAFREARRWRRIHTIGWFSLYDEAPNAAGNEARLGLITHGGRRKPAYHVFRRGR